MNLFSKEILDKVNEAIKREQEDSLQRSKEEARLCTERDTKISKLIAEYKLLSPQERGQIKRSTLSVEQKTALDMIIFRESPPQSNWILLFIPVVIVGIILIINLIPSGSDYTSDGQYRPHTGSEKIQVLKFIVSIFRGH